MDKKTPSPQTAQPLPGNQAHGDWVRRATPLAGVERIEAFFKGRAYAPHRHDTYAIGRTISGVQSFHYRSSMRHSLAGHTIVLHPDELHDGQAGTTDGFHYRMVYVEPAMLQDILQGRPLPFIAGGVSTDPRLFRATQALLNNFTDTVDGLEQDDAMFDLAMAMQQVSGQPLAKPGDFRAAQIAREYIDDALDQTITLDQLATASGRDRWSLSRDFRQFFGTSPYRYITMRRLALVRRLMLAGRPLAECAVFAGFADQSHMSRQFLKTYGISPAKWLRLGVS
ncbi:AraC family transcriptional regulator [Undibacterium sp. TJN19]|uniref:AraC family transcriptional regulator n=1 Tax=Undibacterium sp. TJN19 TaxID=3413055 RepID=UPI003BF24D71